MTAIRRGRRGPSTHWQMPFLLIALAAAPAWAQAPDYPSLHYPTTQYPTAHYPTTRYPSSPPPAERPVNPAEAAARQQSGLDKAEVQTLLRSEGYSRLGAIEADPNSVWVWQADAMKDGRRVRVGIDYRGNVLVISPEANRPCTAPGVNYGVGGLGVGAELSAASACPNP
jgi:hypothetical protein